jgi:hypothetical protein
MTIKGLLPATSRRVNEVSMELQLEKMRNKKSHDQLLGSVDRLLSVIQRSESRSRKQNAELKKELAAVKGQVTKLQKHNTQLKKALSKHIPNLEA